MASFVVHLVFVVLVLSIAVDFFSQGRNVFDSSSDSIAAQSSHYFSGASADGFQSGEAADAEISKSEEKAAKKKKKNEERVKGEERNKEKKEEGKGVLQITIS